MSERNYWVLSDDNCKFEGMTKEQIISAIAEATGATPTHIDDAFITKIKEQNGSTPIKLWVGTQAQYNALTKENNVMYIITDGSDESLYMWCYDIIGIPSQIYNYRIWRNGQFEIWGKSVEENTLLNRQIGSVYTTTNIKTIPLDDEGLLYYLPDNFVITQVDYVNVSVKSGDADYLTWGSQAHFNNNDICYYPICAEDTEQSSPQNLDVYFVIKGQCTFSAMN